LVDFSEINLGRFERGSIWSAWSGALSTDFGKISDCRLISPKSTWLSRWLISPKSTADALSAARSGRRGLERCALILEKSATVG
jgi:hypothetical protein